MNDDKLIGTIATTTDLVLHRLPGRLELKFGDQLLALAEPETEELDGDWNVEIVGPKFLTFVTTSESEADDALEDIGTFYLLTKLGEL